MIANNFFRALGDFFTNVLFVPFDKLRFLNNWWESNIISIILFVTGFIAFLYWMNRMKKYSKGDNL